MTASLPFEGAEDAVLGSFLFCMGGERIDFRLLVSSVVMAVRFGCGFGCGCGFERMELTSGEEEGAREEEDAG